MSSQGTKNLDSGFNESANILLNLWNSAGVSETLGRKKGWRNLVFFSVIFHGPRLMAVVELQRSSFGGWSKTLHGGGRSCRRVKALSSLSPQAFTLSFRSKKKEEMCQGLLQFEGSGVIWFIISEKFRSHRAALQTQRCYTPSKTHTGLSCPSSHLNTQKTHARRVTQTLISPTRAGNYKNYEVSFPLQIPHASLCVNALKPLNSPFSHGKKKKKK